MYGDGEDSVGPAGVGVHESGGSLALGRPLLDDGVDIVFAAHQHLLQPLDDAGAFTRNVFVEPSKDQKAVMIISSL